jgi:hypothetical protein
MRIVCFVISLTLAISANQIVSAGEGMREARVTSQSAQIQDLPLTVLDPNRFFGRARIGYSAAQACPDVLKELFPYCGADVTDKECSLLDSFTSLHALDDPLCCEEAILASEMHKRHSSIAEIQRAIDLKFQQNYPFTKPTSALEAYRAKRLWKLVPDDHKFGKNTIGSKTPKQKP